MEQYTTHERLWTPQQFAAIDADRCVLATEYFHRVILDVFAERTGINPELVESRREPVEAAGLTFHTDIEMHHVLSLEYGKSEADTIMMEIFAGTYDIFRDPEQRARLFMPGAANFVQSLQESGAFARREAGFFTWGSEPLQRLKLACAGLSQLPVIYTQERAKGSTLRSSYDSVSGLYTLRLDSGEVINAPYIILIDDKAPSFEDFPEQQAQGYWMQFSANPEDLLPSQRGSVPANVEVCRTFDSPKLFGSLGIRASTHTT